MTEQITIEQLWYTWSHIGLGSGPGFRIRAASAGLSNIRSAQVQRLDKYLRYKLPLGTNMYQATDKNSPRSLAFLRINRQCILVHKSYLGRDDFNRPGVFIAHLITGVPASFTALQALEIFNAEGWKQSWPGNEKENPIELPTLDLNDNQSLRGWQKNPVSIQAADYPLIATQLPRVITTFFVQCLEQQKKNAQKEQQGLTQTQQVNNNDQKLYLITIRLRRPAN